MILLEIVNGDRAGHTLELDVPAITIGRAEGNEVVLPDYHLSGEHGQVFREDDHVIYRDLRSTNGSAVQRGDARIPVDAGAGYELRLLDGDELLLGDPAAPVVVRVRLTDGAGEAEVVPEVLASRPIAALPEVADKIERDPVDATALYQASKRLGGRVELGSTLEAVCDAVFDLVPRATNVAIFLRSETDAERFTVACSRVRGTSGGAPASPPLAGTSTGAALPARVLTVPGGAPASSSAGLAVGGGTAPGSLAAPPAPSPTAGPRVHASRAVLKRVLGQRAAVLVANAAEELGGSESIMGGRILSTVAVPLWQGDRLEGVIQADNRASAGIFRERDLDLLLVLAAQAALALENARLVSRLRVAEERLRGEVKYLKHREEKRRFSDIIGQSQAMRQILAQLEKVIDTRATICIDGETGTGKELVASTIHYQGRRRDKLFVAQNCAALPETLLESELFGHKRGAFTGADHDKKGLFELADGGTLFLDEVGEMSLGLQAKLLRALQEGTIRPLGATAEKQVDVRIICATNRNLAAEVEKGAFRQDLYYRLMVFPIRLPPLRERREDIPPLAEHFLRRYTQEYRKPVAGFSQGALDAMAAYAWPGNIRELENEVQRLVIQVEPNAFVEPQDLSPQIRKVEGTLARIAPKKGTLKDMVDQVERWLLTEALREHGGNKTKTAETLGITREGLHKKLAKFGL